MTELNEDAKRLERMGLDTCKPNCGCQCRYDVLACRDWKAGVRLIQNYRQPITDDGGEKR